MKKVVVTGATSMVGVALIEECIKKKVNVVALVRKNSKKIARLPMSDLIEYVECDLKDLRSCKIVCKDADVFYHFGWSNTEKEERTDVSRQLDNIGYSVEAVKLANKFGCKKFVGAGSQAEYGIHIESRTGPTSPLNPQDAYGICKMTAGRLCSLEAEKSNMDFAWVRIFSLYGKNELSGTLIQSILPKLLKHEKCSLTMGIQNWDYLYSSDAGEAFYLIGEKSMGNKYYCLGSGISHPIKVYVEEMKRILNSKSKLGFGEIPYKSGVPNGMCADITSLQNDIGWTPKVSFEEGIKRLATEVAKQGE